MLFSIVVEKGDAEEQQQNDNIKSLITWCGAKNFKGVQK